MWKLRLVVGAMLLFMFTVFFVLHKQTTGMNEVSTRDVDDSSSSDHVIVPIVAMEWNGSEVFVLTMYQTLQTSSSCQCGQSTVRKAEVFGPFVIRCPCVGYPLLVEGSVVEKTEKLVELENKHMLVGCSMIKGEDEYLLEWLNYHLYIGFDKFVLYSDERNEQKRATTRSVLSPFIAKGTVQFVEEALGVENDHRQFIAQNHCMIRHKGQAEWVAVFDVDEFFLPGRKTPESIVDVLKKISLRQRNVGSVFVPQMFFGSKMGNGKDPHSVLRRFLYREENAHVGGYVVNGKNSLVGKSITRPLLYRHLHTAHNVELKTGYRVVKLKERDLRINHYWCKSKKEQQMREERGESWRSKLLEWHLCENQFSKIKDEEIVQRFSQATFTS